MENLGVLLAHQIYFTMWISRIKWFSKNISVRLRLNSCKLLSICIRIPHFFSIPTLTNAIWYFPDNMGFNVKIDLKNISKPEKLVLLGLGVYFCIVDFILRCILK